MRLVTIIALLETTCEHSRDLISSHFCLSSFQTSSSTRRHIFFPNTSPSFFCSASISVNSHLFNVTTWIIDRIISSKTNLSETQTHMTNSK
ncbi:hypothetical protein TRIUR3_20857 [Triticum urartu]|uniref:Uncharacterized protein n=1 Tax=Triticum urartu TaxID=4572 RepID=M7Y5H7_TRIUA|nr:hypothetical protein TRIUR3_20857 [Triticum urartu]